MAPSPFKRRAAPRSSAGVAPRPKPTAAAALLLAVVLSLPFAGLALLQAVVQGLF